MKATEIIPASKPRNFVAKNQKTAGAGAHKDKRKAEKQGDVKHKKERIPMDERVRDPEDWDEGNTEPPNNFAVYINGKKWKVFKGRGMYADDYREKQHYQQLKAWADKKSAETGKKWSVSITGETATESIAQESNNDYEQRQKLIKYIAQKKGWDVSDLELAKTSELVLMYKKIKEQDTNESYIQELSSDLLATYKKKAGEQASAADKAGDYEKGNKRFKGIVKATNKQFDNDAKKQK